MFSKNSEPIINFSQEKGLGFPSLPSGGYEDYFSTLFI